VEDERLRVGLDELGQVLLRLADVDERVARVVEDAEVPVDADVDARGLEQRLVVRSISMRPSSSSRRIVRSERTTRRFYGRSVAATSLFTYPARRPLR